MGVFLLADKENVTTETVEKQDLLTIANVLALKSYRRDVNLYVQLLRPETKPFLEAMPDWQPCSDGSVGGDQVKCFVTALQRESIPRRRRCATRYAPRCLTHLALRVNEMISSPRSSIHSFIHQSLAPYFGRCSVSTRWCRRCSP